jgi:hypothetical protein
MSERDPLEEMLEEGIRELLRDVEGNNALRITLKSLTVALDPMFTPEQVMGAVRRMIERGELGTRLQTSWPNGNPRADWSIWLMPSQAEDSLADQRD